MRQWAQTQTSNGGGSSSGEGLHFDDLPLLTYEKEVFCECGAWSNFFDLEDSLTLEELIELYDSSLERQQRLMKTVAAAMGADVSDSGSDSQNQGYNIAGSNDLGFLPISIGYETME